MMSSTFDVVVVEALLPLLREWKDFMVDDFGGRIASANVTAVEVVELLLSLLLLLSSTSFTFCSLCGPT